MESNGTGEKLANGLAWFSIGLGLGELLAPDFMARMIGVSDDGNARKVLRTYGMRGIASGVGLLANPTSSNLIWSRVAGDLMDLAALGAAVRSDDSNRPRLAAAAAVVAGVTALDVFCGQKLSASTNSQKEPKRIQRTIGINQSPDELYRFWQKPENVEKFMEWDGKAIEDENGRTITWTGKASCGFDHEGTVSFQPAIGGRGSVVRLTIEATGPIGSAVSKLASPGLQVVVENILRRFKQVIETGEVVRSDASIHSKMHAAQPPAKMPDPAMAY